MSTNQISDRLNGIGAAQDSDPRMEQIRELLLGEHLRIADARFKQIEGRFRELETKIEHGLDALKARVEALAGEVNADQRTTFDELARGIEDLAHRIRQIPRD